MATSTTSSIQLATLPPSEVSNLTQRDGPPAAQVSSAPTNDDDSDPTLEASRLADSAVPDGGYGWVVVAGCAIVTWWFVGTSYSWGVMQGALVEAGVSDPATLAFVGSMSASFISVLAIVNARVARSLGTRRTAMLGITFLGSSEVLSGFAVMNVAGLFITSGVLLGLGMR